MKKWKIHKFIFNPFEVNTYILYEEESSLGECIVVDPAFSEEREKHTFFQWLEEKKLSPALILLTHGHVDHILGIPHLQQNIHPLPPIYLHQLDVYFIEHSKEMAQSFGLLFPPLNTSAFYFFSHEESFSFHSLPIQIIHLPGHSPGSTGYYLPSLNILFSGDTLFQESIGRTDLPLGNEKHIFQSIQSKLYSLPEETLVYPGHGEDTTIFHEKNNNPFINS